METLNQQVDRARSRLAAQAFVRRLVWWLFGALCVAVVAIAIPKLLVVEGLPGWWATAWLAGSAALGVLGAAVATLVRPSSRLTAAMEIDRRFELRERVASCLELSPDDLQTPAGAALVGDANARVGRIELAEGFGIRPGRYAWAPLAPAAIALALMLLGDAASQAGATGPNQAAEKKAATDATKALREKLAKRRAELDKSKLKDATGLLAQVEKGVEKLAKRGDLAKKDAMVELNDLSKQLAEKRAEMGGREALQKQLNAMKDLGRGPGEKAADAIRNGDLSKAAEEVRKLQEQIARGDLKPEQQKELAEQLGKMQQKLADAAQAHKQAMEDMKKQIEQQRAKGNLEQAAKMQEKLDQMQAAKPQMQQLQKMAQQMAEAQQALQQGDPQQAAEAMQQMAEQLQQMQQEADQMEVLAEAMEQIEGAKSAMNCPACQGQGCPQCDAGMMAQGKGKGDKPGPGMGEGQGAGPRPDEANPTNFRDTRVRQDPKKGAATFGGLVEGPNVRGAVAEQVKEEMAPGTFEAADPVAAERLNRAQQEHAEEYFRRIRDGL